MPVPKEDFALERLSARECVYKKLKEWIIDGTLLPEERISDAEIAQRLHVSRTPVREAFLLLEVQKLICITPCKGTVVAPLEPGGIEEYYLPLSRLLALSASLAAERVTPVQLAILRRRQEEIERHIADGCRAEAQKLDARFHREIARLGGNPMLTDLCDTLFAHVIRLECLYFRRSGELDISVAEHERILRALEAGDSEAAEAATRENWERSMENIIKLVRKAR